MGTMYTLEDGKKVEIYTERLWEVAESTLLNVDDFVGMLQEDEDLAKYGDILSDLLDVAKQNMQKRFGEIAKIIGKEYAIMACAGQPEFKTGQVVALSETYDGEPPKSPEECEKDEKTRKVVHNIFDLALAVQKYATGDPGNLEVVEKCLQALETDDKGKTKQMIQILVGGNGKAAKAEEDKDFRSVELDSSEGDQLQRVFEVMKEGGKDWEALKGAIAVFYESAVRAILGKEAANVG